jgi:hypothetical protein
MNPIPMRKENGMLVPEGKFKKRLVKKFLISFFKKATECERCDRQTKPS